MADMAAVKAALQQALALVSESEASAMKAKRAPVVAVEMDAKPEEECPDCAAGDCAKHPSDEDVSALEAALK